MNGFLMASCFGWKRGRPWWTLLVMVLDIVRFCGYCGLCYVTFSLAYFPHRVRRWLERVLDAADALAATKCAHLPMRQLDMMGMFFARIKAAIDAVLRFHCAASCLGAGV